MLQKLFAPLQKTHSYVVGVKHASYNLQTFHLQNILDGNKSFKLLLNPFTSISLIIFTRVVLFIFSMQAKLFCTEAE